MPAELIEYFLEASNLEELTAAGNAIAAVVAALDTAVHE